VRRAVVETTHPAIRWTATATAVRDGPGQPAINRVHLTCTVRAVRSRADVNTEVDVIRPLDSVHVRLDLLDFTASSVCTNLQPSPPRCTTAMPIHE